MQNTANRVVRRVSNMHKFMFDNAIFDLPIDDKPDPALENNEPAEPAVPPPPGVTLEELEQARKEAYELGVSDGKQSIDAMAQDQSSQALQHMALVLDYMLQTDAHDRQQIERQIIDGMMIITRRLFPVLVEQGKIDQLVQFARTVLNDHADEREILIATPVGTAKAILDDLKDMLESRGMTDRVKIVEDKTLGPADCRASWADGGANMLVDRVWKAVEQAAAQAIATAEAGNVYGPDADNEAGAAGALIRDPGPAPVAFAPMEVNQDPAIPDFSTPPEWLAAKIADEPSHVIRELGHDPAAASVAEDTGAELVQEDASANDQQDENAPPATDDPNRPVD